MRKKKKATRVPKKKLFVAVLMTKGEMRSHRKDGDYACFVRLTLKEAVTEAITAKYRWESNPQYGPYVILTGELTQAASIPSRFKLEKI